MKQRELMKLLFLETNKYLEKTIRLYAEAEKKGMVKRNRNTNSLSPTEYSRILLKDGLNKNWLS